MESVRHIRLFVASPMDLTEERDAIRATVGEVNLTAARLLGTWVEVLAWETHSYPSMGPDVQTTVNRQMGDSYDIFLGLAWTRMGTRTQRAESGTIEEFERAVDRLKTGGLLPRIMFYFIDSPVRPSDIDSAQLERLRAFQDRLRALGMLYWTVSGGDDLAQKLRVHLTRVLEEIVATPTSETSGSPAEARLRLDRDVAQVRKLDERVRETWEKWLNIVLPLTERLSRGPGEGLWPFTRNRRIEKFFKLYLELQSKAEEAIDAHSDVDVVESSFLTLVDDVLRRRYGAITEEDWRAGMLAIKAILQEMVQGFDQLPLHARSGYSLVFEDLMPLMTARLTSRQDGIEILMAKNKIAIVIKECEDTVKNAVASRRTLLARCDLVLAGRD